MNTISNRRSIRKYSGREVPDALLRELLSKAERTPTMGNLQLYSVVITRDSEMKGRLAPAHFNQPMVENAAAVLTFCADFHRTTLWAENRKGTPGYDNFLSFLNAATDALLYCQTFTNLAEAEGIGTCFRSSSCPWQRSPSAGRTKHPHSPTGCPSRAFCTKKPTPTTRRKASTNTIR